MAIPGAKRGRPKLAVTKQRSSLKFTSYIGNIQKEIDKISYEKTKEASDYLVDKIRSKIEKTTRSGPGQPPARATGDLIKGVGYKKTSPTTALVGFHHPAQHAHLMEFGTKIRTTKGGEARPKKLRNIRIDKRKAYLESLGQGKIIIKKMRQPRNTGKVEKRPFLLPTFIEETENIKRLMSTGWLE
jgi:hypothetical protein